MTQPHTQPSNIRPLTEHDGQLFISFFQSLSQETNAFFFPHDLAPDSLSHLISKIPTDQNVARYMASVGEGSQDVMAGYVFFWDWKKKIPWFGICVSDAYQGRGIGRQMMSFAVNLARKNHKGGILLTVMQANDRAQALYKSAGFEKLGQAADGQHLMILRFDEEEP